MPVLLLLAGAAILVGVVGVAVGRGGEMAEFPDDRTPPSLDDLVTAADVAALRPPSALWGYNIRVTDEALSRVAQLITERDVEIAVLRQQLADLRAVAGPARSADEESADEAAAGEAAVNGPSADEAAAGEKAAAHWDE